MRVAIGSDHAGFELKQVLAAYMKDLGHEIVDMGTHSLDPVDYPDFAEAVSKEVVAGRVERGVLICGSGVGASVAANKVPGIRAGTCHDTYSAHQGVEHDDVNILVVGSRVIGVELAKEITAAFLRAVFSKEERHRRRLNKVIDIEHRYLKGE
jgi:RpiB/LacA/LacB family sugar-phosphate isomerase